MEMIYFFLFIAFLVIGVIVTRLLGAWMLRINEVIKHQQTIIMELKKLNAKNEGSI